MSSLTPFTFPVMDPVMVPGYGRRRQRVLRLRFRQKAALLRFRDRARIPRRLISLARELSIKHSFQRF